MNDCSPDQTDIIDRKIINSNNNNRIKYFIQEKNVGVSSNFLLATKQCKGKYIAICEGDDYWTDLYKLQKKLVFKKRRKSLI